MVEISQSFKVNEKKIFGGKSKKTCKFGKYLQYGDKNKFPISNYIAFLRLFVCIIVQSFKFTFIVCNNIFLCGIQQTHEFVMQNKIAQ